MINVLYGDMLEILPTLEENSFDSCVTDPPYHLQSIVKRFKKVEPEHTKTGQDIANRSTPIARLARGFMGKEWDGGDIAFRPETWAEVYRVLKPGAFLVAFSGTRTYHRIACAIEDAGFEVRDQLAWVYGSGFPKSHDISKAIDKMMGCERVILSETPTFGIGGNGIFNGHADNATYKVDEGPVSNEAQKWGGWGTALKPAWEPIVLARKPLSERTVAANILQHGCGGLNIDACRVGCEGGTRKEYSNDKSKTHSVGGFLNKDKGELIPGLGRWPANVAHDGSDEVLAEFAKYGESKSGTGKPQFTKGIGGNGKVLGGKERSGAIVSTYCDTGTPARFFYSGKANAKDRAGSKHPTVKPVSLMEWLCSLVTQPGGTVLDPFAGSGTTGIACKNLDLNCTLIEREKEYIMDIYKRFEEREKEREYT